MVPVPCVGPFGTAVERVGTFYYTRTQKREILRSPGLQHVSPVSETLNLGPNDRFLSVQYMY